MKNAILHISDLHFVQMVYNDKLSLYNIDYENRLLTYLNSKQNKNFQIKYLVVSGDIADKSTPSEYQRAIEFLNKIVTELKIEKKNVVICPGNHDVSRSNLDDAIEARRITDLSRIHLLQEEKFEHFKGFFDVFFEGDKSFDVNKSVVDFLIDEDDKIIFLSLNSCYHESNQKDDHFGYINKETFSEELEALELSRYPEYAKILVMHHNPQELSEITHTLKNWKEINSFTQKCFKTILCGHIHDSDSIGVIKNKQVGDGEYYLSVGSLLKKNVENSFNLIYRENNTDTKAKVEYYQYLIKKNPFWQQLTESDALNEVTVYEPQTPVLIPSIGLDIGSDVFSSIVPDIHQNPKSNFSTDSSLDRLLDIVQQKKLFKSGHFHWSRDFKSHGIIDVNYLMSDNYALELITSLFYKKITNLDITSSEKTIILGIGIEGNIVGARLSVLFPKFSYSFIPTHDKKNFTELEKALKDNAYETVIIIKDIIFEADSIKGELESIAERGTKNIYIISLFYCGLKDKEINLFEEKNINHLSICNKIKINKCTHDCTEKCAIEEYRLDNIYELYNEEV